MGRTMYGPSQVVRTCNVSREAGVNVGLVYMLPMFTSLIFTYPFDLKKKSPLF